MTAHTVQGMAHTLATLAALTLTGKLTPAGRTGIWGQ
jgi:hypothetical protein